MRICDIGYLAMPRFYYTYHAVIYLALILGLILEPLITVITVCVLALVVAGKEL